jgi:hypothetical protein
MRAKARIILPLPVWLLAGFATLLDAQPQPTPAAGDGIVGVTAVCSRVSNDYVRTKLPDGTFQTEYYAFGEGGNWGGEMKDATIDKLRFPYVAHVIATPLASQGYLPATDSAKTRLVIMVYWGTTAVPEPSANSIAYEQFSDAQAAIVNAPTATNAASSLQLASNSAAETEMNEAMAMIDLGNSLRDRLDYKNARMLGYDSEGLIGTDYGNNLKGAFALNRNDLISEIEENRYFVVLMAYDFQLMWKQKKHKLLWETRFSINERHNQFGKALPVMAQYASRYFGQDSNGLLRARVPEGRVNIGEVKSLGEVPEK